MTWTAFAMLAMFTNNTIVIILQEKLRNAYEILSQIQLVQLSNRALTYCKSFNVRRTPINPKEIAEKYEKLNMQILVEANAEIRNNNKTNGVCGSSCGCIRHISVNLQVAR